MSLFVDQYCDLCKEIIISEDLITINIQSHKEEDDTTLLRRKQQLIACPPCLNKLVKVAGAYLGNLLVGAKDTEEVIELC